MSKFIEITGSRTSIGTQKWLKDLLVSCFWILNWWEPNRLWMKFRLWKKSREPFISISSSEDIRLREVTMSTKRRGIYYCKGTGHRVWATSTSKEGSQSHLVQLLSSSIFVEGLLCWRRSIILALAWMVTPSWQRGKRALACLKKQLDWESIVFHLFSAKLGVLHAFLLW
jgi:hypothetical protein